MAKKAILGLMIVAVLTGAGSAWADLTDGLVAHWKLDGDANDSAGTNNGIIYGATATTGKIGGALDFNGVDDYIDCGNDSSIKPPLPVTVAAWIKLDVLNHVHYLLKSDSGLPSNYYGIGFYVAEDNKLRAGYGDGGPADMWHRRSKAGTTELSSDTWSHVAAVINGPADMTFYINGLDDGGTYSGTGGDLAYSNGNARIGNVENVPLFFNGSIDDVRIYDRALSAEEIAELSHGELLSLDVVGPDIVAENFHARYKAIADYELASDVDVTDSALWSVEPNDIAGIAAGLLSTEMVDLPQDIVITAEYSEGDVNEMAEKDVEILPICPSGSALDFDGMDDYVEIAELNIDTITMSVWVKVSGGSGERCIVSNWQRSGHGLAYNLYDQNKFHLGMHINGEYRLAFSDALVQQDKWYHVAGTYDGSNGYLYVNGIKQTDNIVETGLITNSVAPLTIGANPENYVPPVGGFFDGEIDEVAIYDRALSVEEIRGLMHTRPDTDDPGLVAYWDFDEGQGQVAGDSSGNGNDGTIINAAWTDSVPPVGICTNRQLMERNFSDVFEIKLSILEQLERALSKEQAIEYLLGECIVGGELGDVKKSDLAKAEHDLSTAVRKENRAKTSVDESIDNLDDALESLDIELPVED